jgi:hypothetical protein
MNRTGVLLLLLQEEMSGERTVAVSMTGGDDRKVYGDGDRRR